MSSKLYINLSNLKYNIENFKKKLLKNQEMLVMVKADAYGAGLVEVSRYLEKNEIKNFGVAYIKEAETLRNSGIKGNIIVFSGLVKGEYEKAVMLDAIYSVSDIETILELEKYASKLDRKVSVEIAIDTGMTRLGFDMDSLKILADTLLKCPHVVPHGIYSHFSHADSDEKFTKCQITLLDKAVKTLNDLGISFEKIHLCNTAGILKYNDEKYNMVRLGIGAYGYFPDKSFENEIDLKGIFKLTAPVCNIRNVNSGRKVSYNGTFETNCDTKIAVLQIGYADGLSRVLSNRYSVTLNESKAKIIGNICMDTCMIDVTNIDVNLGDEVIIFDYDTADVENIAKLTNTISYEVITNVGKRVDRIYVEE